MRRGITYYGGLEGSIDLSSKPIVDQPLHRFKALVLFQPLIRLLLKLFIILALILILYNGLFAQAEVDLQPRKITVGDPVELSISVSATDSASVIWPGPDELAPAEILKVDTLDIGRTEQSVRYTLSIFEPGEFELKDIPVVISYQNETDTLLVNPGLIAVESVLNPADSSQDIRDIHPPVKLAWTLAELMPFILAGAGVVLIAVAAWFLWRSYKIRRGEIVPYAPPPPPAHVTALRRLEELRLKKLWQNGYIKEYHSELTEIVKEYIGGRYTINALEMTTYDVLESRNRWADSDDWFRHVKRILSSGDLVKFARYKPDPRENDQNLTHAFSYVEATRESEGSMVVGNSKQNEALQEVNI